jgi:hypothetical protein
MPRCPAQYESEVVCRGSAIHLSPILSYDSIRLVDHGLLFPRSRIFTIQRPDLVIPGIQPTSITSTTLKAHRSTS